MTSTLRTQGKIKVINFYASAQHTHIPTFCNVTACDCPRFVPTFKEIKFMDSWHHMSSQPILTHISVHLVHVTTVQRGVVTLIACKVF